jgi:hypothetical protein
LSHRSTLAAPAALGCAYDPVIPPPERSLLWSSAPPLIGKRLADNDEPDEPHETLAGRAVVHRAQAPADAPQKAEHAWLRENADEHLQNHLPVHDAGGGAPIGVVELYRWPTARFEAIHAGQRLVWGSAAAGGLFLLAALIGIVRLADRALREQRARLVDAEAPRGRR